MTQGRLRNARQLLVAQAALVWFSGTDEQVTTFIQTGKLGTAESREEVIPYDPNLVRAILKTGKVA